MAVLVFSGGHRLKVSGTMGEFVHSELLTEVAEGWVAVATQPGGEVVLVNPAHIAYVAEDESMQPGSGPWGVV